MLLDYPPREYPEPEDDGKKKDKNKPAKAPKKKKKKEPAFPTPEWALQLSDVIDKVKHLEKLVGDKEYLKLDDEFI